MINSLYPWIYFDAGGEGDEGGGDGGGDVAIKTIKLRRNALFGDGHDLVEWYWLTIRRSHIQIAQVDRLVAVLAQHLGDDLELLSIHDEEAKPLLRERQL